MRLFDSCWKYVLRNRFRPFGVDDSSFLDNRHELIVTLPALFWMPFYLISKALFNHRTTLLQPLVEAFSNIAVTLSPLVGACVRKAAISLRQLHFESTR